MNVPYTYLPDAAVIQNISTNNANYLLSVIGVTNTIGRITFTAISDIQWLNPYWVFASSIFLCGVFTSIAPICYNYTTFVGVSLGKILHILGPSFNNETSSLISASA